MEKKLLTLQIAVYVLFILLVVALGFLFKSQADLKQAQTTQSMTLEQDHIRTDCAGTTAEAQVACVKDIQDLSDTLSQFTKSLGTPGAGTVVPKP